MNFYHLIARISWECTFLKNHRYIATVGTLFNFVLQQHCASSLTTIFRFCRLKKILRKKEKISFWATCLHTMVGECPDVSSEVCDFVATITAQNWTMSCQKYTFVLPQTWLEMVIKSHQK